MNIHIPFLLLLLLLLGGDNISHQIYQFFSVTCTQSQTKKTIKYKKFEFPIDNSDATEFSYIDGVLFDGGIKSMIIDGNSCFFIDEVHKNVKKIFLDVGSRMVSDVLIKESGRSFVDIAIYHGLLYISTCQKKIFVLNKDLKVLRTIELKTQAHNDLLFKGSSGDNMLVLNSLQDTLIELDSIGKEINRKKVSPYYKEGAKLTSTGVRFGEIYHDTILTDTLDKRLYYYTYYARNEESYVNGKKYNITQKENKDIFVNDKYEIKLETRYTHLEDTDIGFISNLDFNDNYMVFFEIAPSLFSVHVYTIITQ